MANKTYWIDIVNKLIEEDNAIWAAHVLSSNIEIFDEILSMVNKGLLIKNCLLCYSVALAAQADLDDVLSQFSIQELVNAYKQLDKKPIQTAGGLMWLLEDIDPEFKWAN